MNNIFPINVPLTIVWHLSKPDGTPFNLNGYSYRLFYKNGKGKNEVVSTAVTASGDTISFTYTTTMPRFAGMYSLQLLLFQNAKLLVDLNFNDAFGFGTMEVSGSNPSQTQENAGGTIHLYTVAEYYLLAPVVPVVGDDGFWWVNGSRIVTSDGENVAADHTVEYDPETKYLIIDKGRVDAHGQSIQQTITDIADALEVVDNGENERQEAEGQGDYSDPSLYPDSRRAMEAGRQEAEGQGDYSDPSLYPDSRRAKEAERQENEEARQRAEGDTESVPGDGSRVGNELQRIADEGSPDDDPDDPNVNTRWAQYKRSIAATERANEAAAAAEHQVDVKRGYGIASVTEPVVSHENGGWNTIRVTTEDNRTYDFQVRNGRSSAGFFADAAALTAAGLTPAVGDYCFVSKAGDGTFPAYIYVCTTAGTWTATTAEFDGEGSIDLEDTLNSDSTTAALTAKQGKVLDGKISQLGQEVNNKTLIGKDASALIGSWWVDGTVITFVASSGMNGTFTSHTAPNKPSSTRPYFRFQNFVTGHKYRLRLTAAVDSENTNKLRFFYAASQTATFNSNRLTDIYGNIADVESGNTLDCLFVAESGKTYIGFTADSFGIDETATITNFSITEEDDIKEIYDQNNITLAELEAKKLNLNQSYGALVQEYTRHVSKYLNTNGESDITGTHYRTKYYDVTPGQLYKLSGYTYNNDQARLAFICDSNDVVLSQITGTKGAVTQNMPVIMPANASYVIISGNTNRQDAILAMVGQNESDTKWQEYQRRIDVDEAYHGIIYNNKEQAICVIRHLVDMVRESSDGTRLSLVFKVYKGWKVTWQGTFGAGCLGQIYSNVEDCLIGSSAVRLQNISLYTTSSVSGTINYDGYLGFKFKKSDESAFSDQDVQDALDSLTFEIRGGFVDATKAQFKALQSDVDALKSNSMLAGLFLGTITQGALTASGFSTNSKRVSTLSATTVPYKGARIKFTLPVGYKVEIRSGAKSNNLTEDDYWYADGDTFTFDEGVVYYRLSFAKFLGATDINLYVSEINALIASGEIAINYKDDDNIIDRNAETEKYVKAMLRTWAASPASSESHVMPIFAHTSDVHGDAIRFRQFLDYCDYLDVDAALVSGDVVALYPADRSQYINDVADKHHTMTLLCVGNHDGYGLDSQGENEQIIGYLMTKHEVVTNPNETYPTYFYKDLADKKIRIISLNSYEGERLTYTTYFSEEQCNWFINALASTPQDYGVIVMYHALESAVVKENAHSNFYQDIQRYTGYWQGTTNEPVKKIIDAFISKTTLSLTYSTRTYTEPAIEVSVEADFTSLASGVEFIAHVTGHEHADGIGLVGGVTNRQVMLNVCCGVGMYGIGDSDVLARLSDLPREGRGSVQDAFNIYAIDRDNGTIRIARVGSNMASDGIKRDFLIMPYRNN